MTIITSKEKYVFMDISNIFKSTTIYVKDHKKAITLNLSRSDTLDLIDALVEKLRD